jgi:hypothetical protein
VSQLEKHEPALLDEDMAVSMQRRRSAFTYNLQEGPGVMGQ